jgi:IS30 family transposase
MQHLISHYREGGVENEAETEKIFHTSRDGRGLGSWDRWENGESLHSIARHFGRSHSSIQGVLGRTGGIRPLPRIRSRLSLTLAEREEISRGLSAGHSLRAIASSLGRAASTVSRELSRNGGRCRYRAHAADEAAWDRARRPKRCKLALNRPLATTVARLLRQRWSPWQIAGRLKREYPHDESCRVSHETIYKTLFIQARGALKKELVQHLRRRRHPGRTSQPLLHAG